MEKVKKIKVNQAIELLWLNKKDAQKKKTNGYKIEKSLNIHAQCKIMHHYKKSKRQHPVSSSKYRILSEIKSHTTKKNWSKVKNLFLLLLNFSIDIEPLIWRYSLILSLYSNIDNLSNISQLFETCIGASHSDKNLILKNLLLLRHK
ncbi:uncharacterized protein [Bombus fervidus]|uniref:uncharacterized protein n=1 Tax=Bombus fervidus TaxID=203811 RepID=UPI003D18A149